MLQKKHAEAERRRNQREKELSESINTKGESIAVQESKLKELEEKCEKVNADNAKLVDNEVEIYLKARSAAMNEMSADIRGIVDDARNASGESSSVVDEIRTVWETETNRITAQEKLCITLNNELSALLTTLDTKQNITEEEKNNLEQQKSDLEKNFDLAKVGLEECYNNKAKSLAKYEHDFKNRYEIICWERSKSLAKANERKERVENEKREHESSLQEAEGLLDEVKTKYYNALSEENEKIANERMKVDQAKKDAIKQSIKDQREFNDKVQQYRELLTKSQEKINTKKSDMEGMRAKLTELMKSKSDSSKAQADLLRTELNDKIEDVHELEKNHDVIRTEEEKVVQNLLEELNKKKRQNEIDMQTSENILIEFEKNSREKILLLQEEVDMFEKTVIQCRSDIDRDAEKIKEITKLHEGENTKLDTDLLYVGYLLEKDLAKDADSAKLETVLKSKSTLEQLTEKYREQIESIKQVTDKNWKPLVEGREEAQVVLEDLIRTRGIAEVTLAELKEQFKQERKAEQEEIDRLREKLEDFEEERKIADECVENEIAGSTKDCDSISINQRLMEEKRK